MKKYFLITIISILSSVHAASTKKQKKIPSILHITVEKVNANNFGFRKKTKDAKETSKEKKEKKWKEQFMAAHPSLSKIVKYHIKEINNEIDIKKGKVSWRLSDQNKGKFNWFLREQIEEDKGFLPSIGIGRKRNNNPYTDVKELQVRVKNDILQLFYDNKGTKRKVNDLLFQPTKILPILSNSDVISDADRFSALMEVKSTPITKEGYYKKKVFDLEKTTIEEFFKSSPRKTNKDVELKIPFFFSGALVFWVAQKIAEAKSKLKKTKKKQRTMDKLNRKSENYRELEEELEEDEVE